MRKSVVLLACIGLALVVYAQDTAQKPVITFQIANPLDDVWQAVIETFSDLNIPLDKIEKDSGLITTDWIRLSDKKTAKTYMNCREKGGALIADITRRVRFNVFIKKTEEGSQIKINCNFQWISTARNGSVTEDCTTTGVFEKKIFEAIEAKFK
jgi:uncharacterized lipoprotein